MSFSDLEYDWREEMFELVDVSVHRRIALQEQDEDGEWTDRSGSWVDSEKFENPSALRYSDIQGTLTGKARYSDYMDQMILGVPEDKGSGFSSSDDRIDSIGVQIRAVSDKELDEYVRKGRVQYFEASEYNDERVHVTLFISTQRFDEICRAAVEPDVTFQIGINMKCWHWTGPIGDGKTFFKTDGYDKAELAYISLSRQVTEPVASDQDDQD